jgi:hypothetical protein
MKPPGAKKFIRLDKLAEDYTQAALRERCSGKRIVTKKSDSGTISAPSHAPEKPSLLIDIQSKMQEGYGAGFRQWATIQNIKSSAKTLMYLQEVGIDSYEELVREYSRVSSEFYERNNRLKEIEKRMADIAELRYFRGAEVYTDALLAPLISNAK